MNAEHEIDGIVRSWLEDGVTALPDRVLDDVLDVLPQTRQRRSWPLRRVPDMNTYAKDRRQAEAGMEDDHHAMVDGRAAGAASEAFTVDDRSQVPVRYVKLAIAAVAVVVVAVAGTNLLSSRGGLVVGGPAVSSSPSRSPSSSASPTRDPLAAEAIEPGSYVIATSRFELRLAVPGGWSGDGTHIERFTQIGPRGSLSLEVTPYRVSHLVADVCADEAEIDLVEVGPTVEDLTTALANQVGVQGSGPTDVTLGGYPAKKFVMRLDPACARTGGSGIWADATGTYGFWLEGRDTGTVYVVDVNGDPLVIASRHGPQASAEDIAQLEAITASIDIESLPIPGPPTDVGAGGWLSIGRHALNVDGIPLSFSVPALVRGQGWARYGNLNISKDTVGSQGAEAVIYWTGFPNGVDADPCVNLRDLPVDPSAADLANAVSTGPGTDLVTGPADVTVGGRAAKHVVVTVRDDLGCDPGFFFTWDPARGGPAWWNTDAGDTIRAWIVDVDGALFVIVGETTVDASTGLEQELLQIVDSIQFE